MGLKVYLEETVYDTCGIGLHHVYSQQRQFVLPCLGVTFFGSLSQVLDDVLGDVKGIADVLQQSRLIGFEGIDELGHFQ